MASSHIQPSKSSQTESAAGYPESRPHSVLSLVSTDRSHSVIEGHRPVVGSHSGKFVANFCQAVLGGGGRREERAVKTGGDCDPTNVSTTERYEYILDICVFIQHFPLCVYTDVYLGNCFY